MIKTELEAHLYRLVHIARSTAMKRALFQIDPYPDQNFWRLIHGNQLDIAVLEWCKIFGGNSEKTHWKRIVPSYQHDVFRDNLLTEIEITEPEWLIYWNEMKAYRDNHVAHHTSLKIGHKESKESYPTLNIALKSSNFYYKYIISELKRFGESDYPDDLEIYCDKFKNDACRIAEAAVESTKHIESTIL